MQVAAIEKSGISALSCNVPDYQQAVEQFSWETARELLDGLPGGGLNIAHEAVDRHAISGKADMVALRWIAKDGHRQDFTYATLATLSNRFANVLGTLGVKRGERVFSLLGRVPELYITVLGTLKCGCVYCPLFSAFGPEPVKSRMEIGDAKVLVTTSALYRRKVAGIRQQLPNLEHVLLIDDTDPIDRTASFTSLMATASLQFTTVATAPEDMALLHFTSGTTGKPKGAIHVHEAVVAHNVTGRFVLDLREGDTYWCTADPGWVTGTSYGIIAPLTNGVTMIVDEAEFDALRWYRTLAEESVNVWYTAPTAIRMLMKAGDELPAAYDLSSLRFLASVGEPLNPEAVEWSNRVFGIPFHDNWWQTETGGIMIANFSSLPVKPGSMGKPLPGITAGILDKSDTGIRQLVERGTVGELALRRGWPSMMRGYLHEQARYEKCFVEDWYLSGDLAMQDEDGYFWFVGRADDVIKSAGHLIGPFEVESALMEHEAVAEAAVIGLPDETVGEVVKAYVELKPGFTADDDTLRDILGHARKRLGPAVAPKEIVFRAGLPKTRSGKIMRRLLKARELGLPEGDISTLESDER
jgi:acetyl-CoA synthetase